MSGRNRIVSAMLVVSLVALPVGGTLLCLLLKRRKVQCVKSVWKGACAHGVGLETTGNKTPKVVDLHGVWLTTGGNNRMHFMG